MDDVELRSVSLAAPLTRTLVKESGTNYKEKFIIGEHRGGAADDLGVLVAYSGDLSKPAILTYHDLGLNHVSNFQTFFNYGEMQELLRSFCVVHINAPGQEECSPAIDATAEYPTMEDLSEQITDVLNELGIVKYIGFGVGLGANVLIRHTYKYPERVDSLILVNGGVSQAGWIEWGYQKRNVGHLKQNGVSQAVLDYLIWHHFGSNADAARSHDLLAVYRQHFMSDVQPTNLAKLIEQYIARSALNVYRKDSSVDLKVPINDQTGTIAEADHIVATTLKVPVLNIVGSQSPFVDSTVDLNGRLEPQLTTWLKVQDCACVLEEQPSRVTEAIRLFLQGQGYCLHIRRPTPATSLL